MYISKHRLIYVVLFNKYNAVSLFPVFLNCYDCFPYYVPARLYFTSKLDPIGMSESGVKLQVMFT